MSHFCQLGKRKGFFNCNLNKFISFFSYCHLNFIKYWLLLDFFVNFLRNINFRYYKYFKFVKNYAFVKYPFVCFGRKEFFFNLIINYDCYFYSYYHNKVFLYLISYYYSEVFLKLNFKIKLKKFFFFLKLFICLPLRDVTFIYL